MTSSFVGSDANGEVQVEFVQASTTSAYRVDGRQPGTQLFTRYEVNS